MSVYKCVKEREKRTKGHRQVMREERKGKWREEEWTGGEVQEIKKRGRSRQGGCIV